VRRGLLYFAAVVSLLLLLLTVIVWSRSYRTFPTMMSGRDRISFTDSDPLYWIVSMPGKAVLCRQTGHDWSGRPLRGFHWIGVSFGGSHGPNGGLLWNLEVPYWLLTVLWVALPLIGARQLRRDRIRRRARMGCCPSCGYDLRATPDRCPECGRANPIPR